MTFPLVSTALLGQLGHNYVVFSDISKKTQVSFQLIKFISISQKWSKKPLFLLFDIWFIQKWIWWPVKSRIRFLFSNHLVFYFGVLNIKLCLIKFYNPMQKQDWIYFDPEAHLVKKKLWKMPKAFKISSKIAPKFHQIYIFFERYTRCL